MAYQYRSPLEGCYEASNDLNSASQPSSSGRKYGDRHKTKIYQPSSRNIEHQASRRESGRSSHKEGVESSLFQGQHTSSLSLKSKYSERFKSSSYPPELTAMFGALDCKLCGVEVPTNFVAKMHYSGKQHMKKIKSYLQEWSLRTGQTIPEIEASYSTTSSVTALADHCEVCDVRMLSNNDKILHYSGKNHIKNERNPKKAKKRKMGYDIVEMPSSFGIGCDFNKVICESNDRVNEFECIPCKVKAVSKIQLETHLNGKKHKERIKKSEQVLPKPGRPYSCDICLVSLQTQCLLDLHLQGKKHAKMMCKNDIKKSGADSCEICQVSFTGFEQYEAHMQSKKHKSKCEENVNKSVDDEDHKSSIACKYCTFVGNIDNHKCDKSLLQLDPETYHKKWVCHICYHMAFDTEEEYNEHKTSQRHVLCVLNQAGGDKVVKEYEHLYCLVCNKQYESLKDYTDHLFEETHLSLTNVQANLDVRTDLYKCESCDLFMDDKIHKEHIRSRSHLIKESQKQNIDFLRELSRKGTATLKYKCNCCDVILPNFVNFTSHLFSEPHMNRMIEKKLEQ